MDGDESNPTSPSGRFSSGSYNNKRFRTQMTTVQLKAMKSIFVDYKTPSMCECESLGKEIGLPKRVVQVWFQNARAKEKKAKLAFVKTFGHEMEPAKVSEECTLCDVKYNLKYSPTTLQEHIFSKKHIESLKTHIDSLKKLTDGQDSDTSFDSMTTTSNHVTPTKTPNSGDKATDLAIQKTKEIMVNGDQAKIEKEEDGFLPATTAPETSTNNQDFASPATSNAESTNASSTTPSNAAGLFPYMYSPFPGYYGGMPGAFLHHAMYPGRTKL